MNRIWWAISGILVVVVFVLGLELNSSNLENRRMRVALRCAYQQVELAKTHEQRKNLSLALLFDAMASIRLNTARRDALGGCLEKFGLLSQPPE